MARYHKELTAELATALYQVTSAYRQNLDIIHAVRSCVGFIQPPVREAFERFLSTTSINPNVRAAIKQLENSLDNTVFKDWCKTLYDCQSNSVLVSGLMPIVTRLSILSRANGELEIMLQKPQREFKTMVGLVVAILPLIFLLQPEWVEAFIKSVFGQSCIAVVIGVIAILAVKCFEFTRPLKFKG